MEFIYVNIDLGCPCWLAVDLAFIVACMMIACCSVLSFDFLVKKKHLPQNPVQVQRDSDFDFKSEVKSIMKGVDYSASNIGNIMLIGWIMNGF